MPDTPVSPELPALPQPYPYLRIGYLGAPALPEGIGTALDLAGADIEQELTRGLDAVVVSAENSVGRIEAELLELLITCEAAVVPTVLRASASEHLRSPVAAVVSQIAVENEELYQQALEQVGPERAFLIQPVVDPKPLLTEVNWKSDDAKPEAIARRRQQVAERSPQQQASRFLEFLGLPVEPQPLVTALIVSRHAQNLGSSLANLKRQDYSRIDPLLVIDPLYESLARELTADWDIPLRIVVANPRATQTDRLNLGVQHAYGHMVAIIEETGIYGSRYLTDQVQALQHAGAHLVGKASWFVRDSADAQPTVHAPGKQWQFDQIPALGTLVFHRQTAEALGFIRRGTSVNRSFAQRIRDAGGTVFVSHAYDTVLLQRDQTLVDLGDDALNPDVAPLG